VTLGGENRPDQSPAFVLREGKTPTRRESKHQRQECDEEMRSRIIGHARCASDPSRDLPRLPRIHRSALRSAGVIRHDLDLLSHLEFAFDRRGRRRAITPCSCGRTRPSAPGDPSPRRTPSRVPDASVPGPSTATTRRHRRRNALRPAGAIPRSPILRPRRSRGSQHPIRTMVRS